MERELVTRTANTVALIAATLLVGDLLLGWSGWGFSVGVPALMIAGVALALLRGWHASVDVAGVVGVEVESTLGPAWCSV